MKQSYVYIMTNKVSTVLYTGVCSDLVSRVYKHKIKHYDGFTAKYNIDKLVYFEIFEDIREAIKREKQIKNWHRTWKMNQIKKINPGFKDLYPEIIKQ